MTALEFWEKYADPGSGPPTPMQAAALLTFIRMEQHVQATGRAGGKSHLHRAFLRYLADVDPYWFGGAKSSIEQRIRTQSMPRF